MSKTPRSESIARSITELVGTDLPATPDELTALLTKAARLGKIGGLRRARKAFRTALADGTTNPFESIEKSIKSTYVALGFDTDAYEADQKERHPERYGLVTVPDDASALDA